MRKLCVCFLIQIGFTLGANALEPWPMGSPMVSSKKRGSKRFYRPWSKSFPMVSSKKRGSARSTPWPKSSSVKHPLVLIKTESSQLHKRCFPSQGLFPILYWYLWLNLSICILQNIEANVSMGDRCIEESMSLEINPHVPDHFGKCRCKEVPILVLRQDLCDG